MIPHTAILHDYNKAKRERSQWRRAAIALSSEVLKAALWPVDCPVHNALKKITKLNGRL